MRLLTIHDYLRTLRERWRVVTIAVLFGLGGATAFFFLRPPQYTAELTMYVSSQGADTTQAAYQGAQLSENRVASYTDLVTSPRVIGDVIRRLGLTETEDELAKRIIATSKLDSVLIDVTATDPSPQRAADVVNAVGGVFPNLVAELERSTTPGAQPVVAVRVVQPALVPNRPSSLPLWAILVIGLMAGMALGAVAALFRNAMDVTIRSPEQLRAHTGSPNLGIIAYNPSVPSRPLMVHDDPQSPRSEAFRQLRTNIQFVDVDNPRKVVVVTSSMPSEGKTTTLANLAIAMSSAANRVLLIEADLRRPRLSELLGVHRSIGLTNVLSGRIDYAQAIQPWAKGAFDILASGPLPPNPSELLGSRSMRGLIDQLRMHYDVILIDTPPLLPVTDAAAVAPATDGAILISRYKHTKRAQIDSAIGALEAVGVPVLGTVLTMVPNTGVHAYSHYQSYYQTESRPAPSPSPRAAADGRIRGAHSAKANGVPQAYLHSGANSRDRSE
jgi:polysaccharide biosynthesis transport protein